MNDLLSRYKMKLPVCQQGVLGDEKHLMYECPAVHMHVLCGRYENLFQAPRLEGDAMILFMWQNDIIGVARFTDACLQRVYTTAEPPVEDQESDQP